MTGQSKVRLTKMKTARLQKLRYACKMLGGPALDGTPVSLTRCMALSSDADDPDTNNFVLMDHSFGFGFAHAPSLIDKGQWINVSPQGVDALPRDQLANLVEREQLASHDLRAHVDLLSTDELEARLDYHSAKITSLSGSLVTSGFSSCASSLDLDELGKLEEIASQLSYSHFKGVVNTVLPPGRFAHPMHVPPPHVPACTLIRSSAVRNWAVEQSDTVRLSSTRRFPNQWPICSLRLWLPLLAYTCCPCSSPNYKTLVLSRLATCTLKPLFSCPVRQRSAKQT